MKTLQEKYNAILEGNFSKKQFVRDARLAHSNLITQFNSFADTVAILKNKGMVVEAKKAEVTAYMKPEVDPIDMVAPDLLDHGIEAELHAAGITGTPSEEEYAKAKEKAAKELIKDPLCYKNAQTMTEPGEKMEKAKLSEETALDRVERNASTKVQNKLADISSTVGEEPASVAAAFRKKVLADPTHFGKMSAHELEKEFIKFAQDMKVDKEADKDQAYKDGVTQASIDMAMQQAGMKETQLKEGDGSGAPEEEIKKHADEFDIYKNSLKPGGKHAYNQKLKDFKDLAAGRLGDIKAQLFPKWELEDFAEIIKDLPDPFVLESNSQQQAQLKEAVKSLIKKTLES